MSHKQLIYALLSFLVLFSGLMGCSGSKYKVTVSLPFSQSGDKKEAALQDWQYEQSIPAPITGQVGDQTVNLGDLNTNNVEANIMGNTFDSSTVVSLQTPAQVPQIDGNALTPLGSPLEISAGGPVRLNKPITMTWKVSERDKYLADMKRNDIWVTYYNGTSWEYLRPDSYDLNQGLVYFTTYHLSLMGVGKIDMQKKIEQYIHSKTVAEVTQKDILDAAVNNVVKNALEDLLLDKYNMDEDSVKYKVITSLVNDDEYRDIIENLYNVNIPEANKKLQVIIGKHIAENVGESVLKDMLGQLTSDTGLDYAEAAVNAAGHFAEGQYSEGIRIAGEAIADSFLITNLVKGAGEIVQYNIDQWKDKEIEAAYNAFKNGADNGYWGYNVDAGKFDDLWNQMRGIATKVESDAVQAEIERRKSLGMREATPAELDAVRSKAKADMRKQFEDRAKRDAEIEKEEAKLEELIEAYFKNGLVKDGSYGFDDEMDVDHRLDALIKIRNMIIADSGRKGWSMSPFSNDETVGVGDLILLTKAWYAGEAEYKKQLAKIFGVDKDKDAVSYTIVMDPQKLEGEVGVQYTFTARADKVPASVRYDWTINGKKAQSGAKNSIAPTFNKEGSFQVMVVMYDDSKNQDLCDAVASVTIKAKQDSQAAPASSSPSGGSGGGGGGTFPAEPFNGMQISYSISGASVTDTQDSEGFTVSRTLKGNLGGGNLAVSGSAKMGNGYGADLVVTVTVDGQSKNFEAYIESGYPGFNEKAFNLSVPIPKNASGGSVSIDMTGHYNAGTRGLVVSGNFAGSGGGNSSSAADSGTGEQGSNPLQPLIDLLKGILGSK